MTDAEFIANWNLENGYRETSLFTDRLRENFNESQIAIILKELDNICRHCFDGGLHCQCWNDE